MLRCPNSGDEQSYCLIKRIRCRAVFKGVQRHLVLNKSFPALQPFAGLFQFLPLNKQWALGHNGLNTAGNHVVLFIKVYRCHCEMFFLILRLSCSPLTVEQFFRIDLVHWSVLDKASQGLLFTPKKYIGKLGVSLSWDQPIIRSCCNFSWYSHASALTNLGQRQNSISSGPSCIIKALQCIALLR